MAIRPHLRSLRGKQNRIPGKEQDPNDFGPALFFCMESIERIDGKLELDKLDVVNYNMHAG